MFGLRRLGPKPQPSLIGQSTRVAVTALGVVFQFSPLAHAEEWDPITARTTRMPIVATYPDPVLFPPAEPKSEAPPISEAPQGYWFPSYDPRSLVGPYTRHRDVGIRDRRAYPLGPRAFIVQISSLGHGPEGHAVLTFARREEQRYVIDYSVGQYANNAAGKFANSWQIFTPSVSRYCLNPAECVVRYSPGEADVAAYREGRVSYFGPVPHSLAVDIFQRSRNTTYAIVDQTYYYAALNAAKIMLDDPYIITKLNFETVLTEDASRLLSIYCMNEWPAFCPRHDSRLRSVQAAFRETHSMPYLGRTTYEYSYAIDEETSIIPSPPYRIELGELVNGLRDQRAYSGSASVCRDDDSSGGVRISRDRNTRSISYRGDLSNGFAHGRGELYFTSDCHYVDNEDKRIPKIVGTFENGYLTGRAEYYRYNGMLIWSGYVKNNALEGESVFFDISGSELATAEFAAGEIDRDTLRLFELDYTFQAVPFRPMSIYDAGQHDGDEGDIDGYWRPLTRIVQSNNLTTVFDGETLSTFFHQDKSSLEGQFSSAPNELGYRYEGRVRQTKPDGIVTEFNISGGMIVEPVRVFVPAVGYWQTRPIGPDGIIRYALQSRRERSQGGFWDDVRAATRGDFAPVLENLEAEIGRAGQEVLKPIDSLGREFQTFLCRATGTEEGRNCSVAAGVAVGTDGPSLLDGTGQVVEQGTEEAIDWAAIFDWQVASDMSDFELRELDGDSPMWTELAGLSVSRAPASIVGPTPMGGGWVDGGGWRHHGGYVDGAGWLGFHLRSPTVSGEIRGSDDAGWGSFGASRKDKEGGRRVHIGIDYVAAPGELILAPLDGIVTGVNVGSKVGSNSIFIQHPDGREVRIVYARAERVRVGDVVSRGSPIGRALDIRADPDYRDATNHVHVQYSVPGPGGQRYWASPDGVYRFTIH